MGKAKLDALQEEDIQRVLAAMENESMRGELMAEAQATINAFYVAQLFELGEPARDISTRRQALGYLTEMGAERVVDINETTRRALARTLTNGVSLNETGAQLAARVNKVFDSADIVRSRLIARTETTMAAGFARDFALNESGVVSERRWLSTLDGRTRINHIRLHRQVQPLGKPFKIPNTSKFAMYPGGFSDVGENANCRCVVVPVVASVDAHRLDGTQEESEKRALLMYEKWEPRWIKAALRGFRMQRQQVLSMLSVLNKPN